MLQNLPTETIIPDYLAEHYDEEYEYDTEEISDWLSDQTGFCHSGFEIVREERK